MRKARSRSQGYTATLSNLKIRTTEETTAASQSLSREAARLAEVVRMFALDGQQGQVVALRAEF